MELHPIGRIRTPYRDGAPHQPRRGEGGDFRLELDAAWAPALTGLDCFRYAYVLYLLDRAPAPEPVVHPPWAPEGLRVGLFATRSPARPNPIGLSVVELLRIDGATVHTGPLDALDGTPLLDLKPYVRDLDTRPDADLGWLDDLPDREHLRLHVLGIPH